MEDNLASQNVGLGPPADKMKATLHQLTIFSCLISLPILGAAFWLLFMRDYECEDLLRLTKLRTVIGVAMVVIFIAGNAAFFSQASIILPVYFGIMFLMIMMFTLGMALVGKYPMESRGVPGSPLWLRERLNNDQTWGNIRSCIYDAGICSDLAIATARLNSYQFSMKRLSPIESGCCKPPTSCEMQYINATSWMKLNGTNPINGDGNGTNKWFFQGDCGLWRNKVTQLCYDCESCKLGYLATLRGRWRKLGIIVISTVVILTLIHSIRFVVLMLQLHGK